MMNDGIKDYYGTRTTRESSPPNKIPRKKLFSQDGPDFNTRQLSGQGFLEEGETTKKTPMMH